jgi:hypothetical protein
LYSNLQTRPLVREGATKLQTRNCLKEISWRKKNWSQVSDGRLTPGQTGRLTVGRKLTATATALESSFKLTIVVKMNKDNGRSNMQIGGTHGKEAQRIRDPKLRNKLTSLLLNT